MNTPASPIPDAVIAQATQLRRDLHANPELSGHESATADRIARWIGDNARVVRNLGGHGLAAVVEGRDAGPRVLIRADIDALPITEQTGATHASQNPGVMHACGHDGHTAALAGLVRLVARRGLERGTLIALFQPAEETGAGAQAVLNDPAFARFAPDACFALHNMPGVELGRVALRPGPMCCASAGLRVTLRGSSAHAATPETGRSPLPAFRALLADLPRPHELGAPIAMTTITHARLGEPTFGVSPGDALIHATLRAETDDLLADERARVERAIARAIDQSQGIQVSTEEHEAFPAVTNDDRLVLVVEQAAHRAGLAREHSAEPTRWSEDFGRFASIAPACLFLLGSGTDQPALHDPAYDFPDALLPIAIGLWDSVLSGAFDAVTLPA